MKCETDTCENEATVGVWTQRPSRANLWTKVWWTESEAPKAASRHCGECTMALLVNLTKVLA